MNCYCDDCDVAARSYEDWIVHLTTPQHQDISSSPRIERWVTEQNPTCIIMASLFEKKDPVEVANKFSKFGFLWNFYAHHDQKFFIMQYDTRQTADFARTKMSHETSWRLHMRRLRDLDTTDWAALFPPDAPGQEESDADIEPPSKRLREDPRSDGSTAKSNDSGFISDKMAVEPEPVAPKSNESSRKDADKGKTSEYYDPFELVDSPGLNPPKSVTTSLTALSYPDRNYKQTRPNLVPITTTSKSAMVTSNVTSFVKDLQEMETKQLQTNVKPKNEAEPLSQSKLPEKKKDEEKLATKQAMEQLMSSKKDSSIDEQLDQFFKSIAVSLKDLEKINTIVVPILLEILKKHYANIELCLFDSFQGGIGNPNCSLEISMDGLEANKDPTVKHKLGKEEDRKCEMNVRVITKMLDDERNRLGAEQSPFCGIRMKLMGRASRVHFIHSMSPRHDFLLTPCCGRAQISRRNNIKLAVLYTKFDPAVRSLLCFVFYWATFHNFMSTEYQQIRDFILSLLVIVFLSRKRVVSTLEKLKTHCQHLVDVEDESWLENLCNNEQLTQAVVIIIQKQFVPTQISILDLVKEFFETFGNEELTNQVICTWTADFLPRTVFTKDLTRLPPELKEYKMCVQGKTASAYFSPSTSLAIQNPFELGHNLGASIKLNVFRRFQSACRKTAGLVQELLDCDTEGKPCYLMNIFTPIITSEEIAEEPTAEPAQAAALRGHCELLVRRIHARMKDLKVRDGPQFREECKRFWYFDIDRRFREKFKAHTTNISYYSKEDSRLRNAHLCCLWSNFALDFTQTIWNKCFFIDSTERIWFQEQGHLGENQKAFPLSYDTYLSTLECKGYVAFQPDVRWKHRESDRQKKAIVQPQANNADQAKPFDEEWTLTQMSLTEAQNRKQTGQPVWTFNCLVAYEDREARHENPRISFVVGGKNEDYKSFEYLISTIKKIFPVYQLRMLEIWLSRIK